MYDFHKTRNENNENEFKHKLFQRGTRFYIKFYLVYFIK